MNDSFPSIPPPSPAPPLRLLLTSFDTWLPQQRTNAAAQLVQLLEAELQAIPSDRCGDWPVDLNLEVRYLHRLPVYVTHACDRILAAVQESPPDFIICCGVAESRTRLSLEVQAQLGHSWRKTRLDLRQLQYGLLHTDISHDAGSFVCNGLYYALLDAAVSMTQAGSPQSSQSPQGPQVLFLHVPPLTAQNQPDLLGDALKILKRLVVLPY